MQAAFRVSYSLVVAVLFVLFVILGTMTFYDEPKEPRYASFPEPPFNERQCPPDTLCPEDLVKYAEYRSEYELAQREYDAQYTAYQDDHSDYHRNVFLLASLLGIVAIAVGVVLFQRRRCRWGCCWVASESSSMAGYKFGTASMRSVPRRSSQSWQ